MNLRYFPQFVLVPKPRKPRPQALRVPAPLDRLTVLCNGAGGRKHPLPARAAYTGPTLSNSGTLAATYSCPLCGWKQHWVLDHQTRRPRLLWVG